MSVTQLLVYRHRFDFLQFVVEVDALIDNSADLDDISLLQLARAIYFMKVGIRICTEVDTFLAELKSRLCHCYRGTTDGQVCYLIPGKKTMIAIC